ncbi:unnamed protein product [Calicophoron daubneyi]|uniref:Uncharacterized protein n=1 Tax=Calicophoron daubneyi TaxID=300641 RepID=A0AAV2TJL2_CALDB
MSPDANNCSRGAEELAPIVTYFSFTVPSGNVYQDIFCNQPQIVKNLERACGCHITVGELNTAAGPMQGTFLVEVNYDLDRDGHNAFIQYLQRMGRLLKAASGCMANYRVFNTVFI